jgi:hypothetical protein
MSVGLMDADMMEYSLVPFNLEIMKLSAYYKKKGEIVIFSPTFSPEKNTLFIYRKDYDDGKYPPGLLKAADTEYGGLAFSNNVYQPLPIEIERLIPDTSIYERAESIIMSAPGRVREKKKIFQNMMTAEHCRLSLDGATVWEDYPRQFKFLAGARDLMLHDYDLGAIKGSFEEVKKILARARTDGWATKIGMKFPVQVREGQDLLNWTSLNSNSTFYSLRFDGVMDDDTFNEWVSTCRQRAVYSLMEYHITPSWYEADRFIKEELPKIFRQVIISRSYRVFFSLKYDEGFFPDPRWEDVIKLFNFYHNSYANEPQTNYYKMIADDTMYDFARHCQEVPKYFYSDAFSINKIREIFEFVREYHYPLFKDFYECTAEKLGGKL